MGEHPVITITEYVLPHGEMVRRPFLVEMETKRKFDELCSDGYFVDYEILRDGSVSVEVWTEDAEGEHFTAGHHVAFPKNQNRSYILTMIEGVIADAYARVYGAE